MSIVKIVKYLNCNKDLPENNNIYINNKRDNCIMIFNGKKWIVESIENTLDTMLNKKDIF